MRRSPLRRRTPLRQTSTRRRREERDYRILSGAFLTGRPLCELCEEAPASDCHHKRGRVGKDYLDVSHFAALCRDCHRFAHEQPAEAVRLGISELRIGGAA